MSSKPKRRPASAPSPPPANWAVPCRGEAVKPKGPSSSTQSPPPSSRPSSAVPASLSVTASGNDAASWAAVARCEEGGVNDPTYGYYGIKEWNGFDGYPTAGSAPQSVQLQWEADLRRRTAE